MRKRDREELGRYIRHVADEMGLRDWSIGLVKRELPADQGEQANVEVVYGRKLAKITLRETFRSEHPEDQRQIIVHELVHCHFEPAVGQVRCDLEDHLSRQADRLFWEAFKRNIEYAVDALAEAIAPRMPLIDWPEVKHGRTS
jgi:hypothetical protein